MNYVAIATPEEEGRYLVRFPDLPDCITEGLSLDHAREMAADLLPLWLESCLENGRVPALPGTHRAPRGSESFAVPVPPALAFAVSLRATRLAAGYTQSELAARAGMSQQALAKLEKPTANPSISTIARLAHALGALAEARIVGGSRAA